MQNQIKNIGFIGLGNMGSKMAINLVNAGHKVQGYDLSEKMMNSLESFGVKKSKTLSNFAIDKDIIITMLPNGDIVADVYNSIINKLKPNTILTDCSTIDVNTAKDLHQKCIS